LQTESGSKQESQSTFTNSDVYSAFILREDA